MTQGSAVLTDEERAIFAAAKTVIDKLLGAAEKPASDRPTMPSKYLSIPAYAEMRNVSEATVRSWIKKGLPVTATRPVRVNVPAADLWVDGGPNRLRLVTNVVQSKHDKSEP